MSVNVVGYIKDDMVCANNCPMQNKSPYKISKCTCYKKDVLVEILRKSTQVEQLQAENERLKELLLKTEKLAIGICEAVLIIIDDEPTIDLVNRTITELQALKGGE